MPSQPAADTRPAKITLTSTEYAAIESHLGGRPGYDRLLRKLRRAVEPTHSCRCPDCGEPGEREGHMGCQYPGERLAR